ncbi:hypothetical protein CHLNCDRAFT_58231 [Chlorella variabilis]|uniref:Peptidoglycan binding-like domain-containing protein n=1 Tax=Chlorella variabilis TaxID=554065 RepID=E1ZIC9_CHLVA|nr:hypothetical protein CHLNCDRAFT_58231 [Chlorella variabilis]EFN54135.1 hypothetical protein CHLNCDRAFT_58231 [Chlorella variabilis]|eukprot:XP_005846237.1 hypothetical protein CHLNCDRAFT_58231 [Chlorella variabilis]
MQLAVPQRALTVRPRGARTARSHGRSAVLVRSMLGPYQYKTRVARLRLKGAQVHEFGDRVLQQGSFGDDVMQLQAYLAEQGYFSSDDGLSGYFGDVTGQALQAWQRDQGLRVTGVFDGDCKWTYLREQEAALQQAAQAQAQQVALVVRPPSVPDSWRVQQPGLATGALGLAALVAGASLANSRIKEGRPVPGVTELGRLLRWAVHTLAGATAAVGRGAAVAGRAVQQALEPPPAPAPRRRRTLTPRPEECAAGAAAVVGKRQEYAAAAAAASLAARQAAAQEAAYLSAAGGPAPQAPHGKAQRLSEDELQQRIAVMKGEVSPRTPVPQRPAPRKLPLGRPKPADDPITGSKYGTYYGGRQVRDQVKQYLEGDSGASRAATPAGRRTEGLGFQMSARPRPASKPAKPSMVLAQASARPVELAAAPVPAAEVEVALAGEAFKDVGVAQVAAQAAAGASVLLAGTELEKGPERRGPHVPVVKPGMASPPAVQLNGGGAPAPAPAPRSVPVVKPQKRATIGDMLRSSLMGDGAAPQPDAPLHSVDGGYGYAAAPPRQQQQAAAPRPVNTGSSYGSGAVEEAAGGAAVQYNSDGSVVLASKPIKLVKPAHLLPKTYGYEGGEQAAPTADQRYPSAAPQREQLTDGDMFGGFRRRGF